MSKLNINYNGINVTVAELAIVSSKEQTVLGNFDRDLILRTAGNLKVQVGNKFYDLITSTTESSQTITNQNVIILPFDADLITLSVPEDGTLIFINESKSLYITSAGLYNLIVKQEETTIDNTAKLYLSYNEEQALTGEQKLQVIANAGLVINDISELASLVEANVYEGHLLYSILEGEHYQLIDKTAPYELSSWRKLYVSTKGGFIHGNLLIDKSATITESPISLHISGLEDQTLIPGIESFNGFYIGDNDYTKGLTINTNTDGIVVFKSLVTDINKGYKFLTNNNTPLIINNNSIGIGGAINTAYNLSVNGNSYFSNEVIFNSRTASADFQTGLSGFGYEIKKQSNEKWKLEIDEIFVRSANKTKSFNTRGIDGTINLNYNISITNFDLVEIIPIYVPKELAGSYYDVSTVKTIIPLSLKGTYQDVVRIALNDLPLEEPIKVLENIKLSYGFGSKIDSSTLASYVSYNKDEFDVYYSVVGTHEYNSSTLEYDEAVDGALVKVNSIAVYTISVDSTTILSEGDLLYNINWNSNKELVDKVFAEVVKIDGEDIYIYVYDNNVIIENTVLTKLGNTVSNSNIIELNSSDLLNPSINLNKNINSFNELVENVFFDENELADTEVFKTISKDLTPFRLGNLNNLVDTDLSLANTNEIGLYSSNAYIKGNFVGNKLLLGSQLTYVSNVLTIVDLETVKNRTINGTNGLTGGGTLFASNINISHSNKTWIDKTTLTDNQVISNLSIDTYGHITDWSIRDLITTWSEIESKPTTIAGYGITDAIDLTSAQTVSGYKTFTTGADFQGDVKMITISNDSSTFLLGSFNSGGMLQLKNNATDIMINTGNNGIYFDFSNRLNITKPGLVGYSSRFTFAGNVQRDYTFANKNGTFAMLDDITTEGDTRYLQLTGGTITNTLTVSSDIIANKYRLSALNTVPSSSTDTGILGEIRYTADYIYVCTATDTWKRAAIATW